MVFFPGGGFQGGWIGTQFHNGTSFAKNQKVVVVTANYRLGGTINFSSTFSRTSVSNEFLIVFGFPDSAQIPLKDRNLGFSDQREALSWVQRNIAAFKGDPAKVTICGQSAGAASVDELLLTSTDSQRQPPFRAGISQSGTSYLVTTALALAAASPLQLPSSWDQLTAALQCPSPSGLDCVANKTREEITAQILKNNISFNPVYDGNLSVVANAPAIRIPSKGRKFPLLIGSNSAESFSFSFSIANVLGPIVGLLTDPILKRDFQAVLALYNSSGSDQANSRALLTAFGFQCVRLQAYKTTTHLKADS